MWTRQLSLDSKFIFAEKTKMRKKKKKHCTKIGLPSPTAALLFCLSIPHPRSRCLFPSSACLPEGSRRSWCCRIRGSPRRESAGDNAAGVRRQRHRRYEGVSMRAPPFPSRLCGGVVMSAQMVGQMCGVLRDSSSRSALSYFLINSNWVSACPWRFRIMSTSRQ